MNDALDRMLNKQQVQTNGGEKQRFISSNNFQGAKPGYVFKADSLGIGYYHDNANAIAALDRNDSHKRLINGDDKIRNENHYRNKRARLSGEELLAQAEAARTADTFQKAPIQLTHNGVRAAVSTLQKSIEKNQIDREEHRDDPSQFMESELALNEEIGALKGVAADVSLYPLLASLGVSDCVMSLLAHENSDITISTLSLLVELIDVNLFVDGMESAVDTDTLTSPLSFVESFVLRGGLQFAILNLGRICFDKDDDEIDEGIAGADDVLTLIEALLELEQLGFLTGLQQNGHGNGKSEGKMKSIASIILRDTQLAAWLLDRIGRKDRVKGAFSTIKLHASEVLAALLQNEEARDHIMDFGKIPKFSYSGDGFDLDRKQNNGGTKNESSLVDGIEMLLQAVATCRKKNPTTEEQCEWLENCFDCLAVLLSTKQNLNTFLDAQGIELMLRCIREKVHSGFCSLKVLFFALSATDSKKACERFVDVGGLKSIFPLFMGRSLSIPKPAKCSDAGTSDKNGRRAKKVALAKKEWLQGIETNMIQILYSLIRHLDGNSPSDAKVRLIAKFVEDDCIKCDRLLELFLKYDTKMRQAEIKYLRSEEADIAEREGVDIEFATLHARLRGGGDLYHRASAILAYIISSSKRCCEHITEQLKVQNSGIVVIKAALQEFVSVLDDGEQKQQITSLGALM